MGTHVCRTVSLRLLGGLFVSCVGCNNCPRIMFSRRVQRGPKRFVHRSVVSGILLHSLPDLCNVDSIRRLGSLFAVVTCRSKTRFSCRELSGRSKMGGRALGGCVGCLRTTFLVGIMHEASSATGRCRQRARFGVCLAGPSLEYTLFRPVDRRSDRVKSVIRATICTR